VSLAASMRRGRLRVPASLWIVCWSLAGCASRKPLAPVDVPPVLKVADGQVLTAALHGTGVQIYECRPGTKDPTRFAWIYQAPAADLADRSGKEIGRHYAGPTWEAYDGSTVVADVAVRYDSPDPASIQWLLLRAKTNTGKGIFGKTRFIQRLHTIGGLAPTGSCDAAHVGQRTRVPYSADYYFYTARR
jgi:hypothetical protein